MGFVLLILVPGFLMQASLFTWFWCLLETRWVGRVLSPNSAELGGVMLLAPLLVLLGRLPSGSLWGIMGPVIIFASFFFISTSALPLYFFFELSLLPVLFIIFL